MHRIPFAKFVATGNDFIIVEAVKIKPKITNISTLAKHICNRKFGIGADGLLLLERTKKAGIRMRIFNADGSEAEMCGNGARCTALYLGKKESTIETKAGIIQSQVHQHDVSIKLTQPKSIRFDLPLKLNNRSLKVNFINTGVPHAVIFVHGVDAIDARYIGRQIRYHKAFAPAGTNVNFIEILKNDSMRIRTYERGVEDETLACGTGSVAAALIFALKYNAASPITVHTQSAEVLKVYFNKSVTSLKDIWLQGKVAMIGKGEFFY